MMDVRPNFFIVGAPKCGTTAWADYLATHPDIGFSDVKEPHFFNTDMPGFRWATTTEAYLQNFISCSGRKIVAEASVQYLYSQDAAKNIALSYPDAHIMIMLRRPSDFIRSYHNQMFLNCDEDIKDLRMAWERPFPRLKGTLPKGCREPDLLDYKKVGLFADQVARYFDLFSHAHIKVVFLENWCHNPRQLYIELMQFLDIADDGRADFPKIHQAKKAGNRYLQHLVSRPPSLVRYASRVLKSLPGLGSINPAGILRHLNSRPGYLTEVNQGLADEIEAYFFEDQRQLHSILEKSS